MKFGLTAIGLLCLVGVWFNASGLPEGRQWLAVVLCGFYGIAAYWSGRLHEHR